MKYPITVTADGWDFHRPRAAAWLLASDAIRAVRRHWGLLAALAITAIVYLPTLQYYFGGDDFVVLGDIQYRGNASFVIDTLRMRDVVPNWRPLTGIVYLAEWRAFGLHPMAWRLVNLSVHLSSLVVLYTLVVRLTRRPAVGAVSALIFGVSGSHFDTVTYITALPHVLAMFFVLASLLAMVIYAEDGERDWRPYAVSFAMFMLAFLANEGSFVFAPVVVLAYVVFSRRWQRAPLRLALRALPFVALALGWLSFYEWCTCPQLKFDSYAWSPHIFSNYAVYLSFIAYPAHMIPHEPDALRWTLAGVVALAGLLMLVFGPKLARVAVPGIVLALLPFVPVEIWTASRYTYAAVAFFAPLAAMLAYAPYERLRGLHPRARVPVNVLALLFVATVGALYGWQTHARDDRSGQETERWQLLVNELRDNYRSVPPGTTIYIIDGPWTNPMEQYLWVPSVARALYGDAAAFDFPAGTYASGGAPSDAPAVYLQWSNGQLRPVTQEQVLRARR